MKTLLVHYETQHIDYDADKIIQFNYNAMSDGSLDLYISENIIPEISDEYSCILIEVSLSDELLNLYGFDLAHHIRLSKIEKLSYLPIIMVSAMLDTCALNNVSEKARVLFTKNISLVENDKNKIGTSVLETIKKKDELNKNNFIIQFLDKIKIDEPTGRHGISNQWSIHLWAKYLKVETGSIKINNQKIESTLYFKYLKNLYLKNVVNDTNYKIKKLDENNEKEDEKSKVLYIDDEWNEGWSDILTTLFPNSNEFEFTTFERINKDTNQEILIPVIKCKVKEYDPDIVLLDLRLVASDHEDSANLDSLTGIQLIREIKDINPGIQIIMLTATSRSLILERLYSYGILGYIKKEHPNDRSITTTENINKLVSLVDNGLKRSYLKRIWLIKNKLIELNMIINAEKERENLNSNIKKKTINLYELQENKLSEESEKLFELKSTIDKVYKILDSDMQDKEVFSALIVFKCLEIVIDYCTYEETTYDNNMYITKVYWKDTRKILEIKTTSVENKIKEIMKKRLDLNDSKLLAEVKKIACFRNYNSHSGEVKKRCEKVLIKKPDSKQIIEWFKLLSNIVEKIDQLQKPKVVKKLKPSRLVPNEQRNKNVK